MRSPLRNRLYVVIFKSDSPSGKLFDVVLIGAIIASVLAVMLETMPSVRADYASELYALEWAFTLLFTIEYAVRLYCAKSWRRYAKSFYGIVDLLAILPTYVSLLFPGAQYFLVVRLLRTLRVFRVLKLAEYLEEADVLARALRSSRKKISVFLLAVTTLIVIIGSLMYLVEGPKNGFTSIPTSMYWAVVTLTTVGYGDISPQTTTGRFLSAIIMIIGYAIIAVPTGIVTAELTRTQDQQPVRCPNCKRDDHTIDADYCKFCGTKLHA
ncbi:ion transporter [Longibacter salinarum]|uniref:ion transporter n=1 Tax=Longibacter salinarum TaxID=1850348 RepID=UPI001FEBB829|nr:ion transporter [Longibacter salinarum]